MTLQLLLQLLYQLTIVHFFGIITISFLLNLLGISCNNLLFLQLLTQHSNLLLLLLYLQPSFLQLYFPLLFLTFDITTNIIQLTLIFLLIFWQLIYLLIQLSDLFTLLHDLLNLDTLNSLLLSDLLLQLL